MPPEAGAPPGAPPEAPSSGGGGGGGAASSFSFSATTGLFGGGKQTATAAAIKDWVSKRLAFANAQHHNKDVVIIDGVHKGTAVRTASDVPPGSSLRVSNCHDAVIYLLAPAEYATVTQARSVHWSPYDPVRVVNADP